MFGSIKIQRKTIEKLLNIYDGIEKICLETNQDLFYEKLQDEIIKSAKELGETEKILKQYEMCVKSYLDNKLSEFNIGVVTLLVAIFASINLDIEEFGIVAMTVLILLIGVFSIRNHVKERKLSEILFVLNGIEKTKKNISETLVNV